MFKQVLAGCTFALALALAPTPQALAQDGKSMNRAEVESIIRSYLLEHPELLEDMQQALSDKREAQAAERAAAALAQNSERVFNSEHQGIAGNPDGDVTIVEYFDYNCGFCRRAMNDMNALLNDDENLKFVLKELPILGAPSTFASKFSTAVYRLFPDRYSEFHTRLIGQEGRKDDKVAAQVAEEMDLDVDALTKESEKQGVYDAFQETTNQARMLGITGTPAYVIGNEVVSGAVGADTLRAKIANMRECGKATCS